MQCKPGNVQFRGISVDNALKRAQEFGAFDNPGRGAPKEGTERAFLMQKQAEPLPKPSPLGGIYMW